jgi:hypothetical protein
MSTTDQENNVWEAVPSHLISDNEKTRLLDKVFKFYNSKLKITDEFKALKITPTKAGYIDGSLADSLPSTGKTITDLQSLGILDKNGKETLTENYITIIHDDNKQIIDFKITSREGKTRTLLGSNPHKKRPYIVQPKGKNIFIVSIGTDPDPKLNRHYWILGLDKQPRSLKATVKVEHNNKIHSDTFNLHHSASRARFKKELCARMGFPADDVNTDMNYLIKSCEDYSAPSDTEEGLELSAVDKMSQHEKTEAIKFGKRSDLISQIINNYATLGCVGVDADILLICYLALVSRLSDNSDLNILVTSESGTGKSHLVKSTLQFCPAEDKEVITVLSEKSLFFSTDSLSHKILAIDEDTGADNACHAIRSAISHDEICGASSQRDPASGKMTANINTVATKGIVVMMTSMKHNIDEENRSRFLQIHLKADNETTEKIISSHINSRSLESITARVSSQQTQEKHQNFLRLLKNYHIHNPHKIRFNDSSLRARRNAPKFLALLDATVLMKQFQRPLKDFEGIAYLEVHEEDIELATRLYNKAMGYSRIELSKNAQTLLKVMIDMNKEEMNRNEIRDESKFSNGTLSRAMKELQDFDCLEALRVPKSNRKNFKLVHPLPDLEQTKSFVELVK